MGHTFPIILIDETPIRKRALFEFQKAHEQLEDLKNRWNTYSNDDQAAYGVWINANFGKIIQEIQNCLREIQDRRTLIEQIHHEASTRKISFAEAYRLILAGELESEENNPDFDPDEEAARALFEEDLRERGIDPQALDLEEYENHYQAFREGVGLNDEESTDQAAGGPANEEDRQGSLFDEKFGEVSRDSERDARIKKLYRLLAKQLHPDLRATGGSAAFDRLWLEVQAAYDAGDLEQLEIIAQKFDQKASGAAFSLPTIWELRKMIAEVVRSIRAVGRDLKAARRDRAWGFASIRQQQRGSLKKVYRSVKRDLEEELESVRGGLQTLNTYFEQWMASEEEREQNREDYY